MKSKPRHILALLLLVAFALAGALVQAAIVATNKKSDIRNTKHNLSVNAPTSNTVKAKNANDTQVCVFCHTPHSAPNSTVVAPLWNRKLSAVSTSGSTETYTPYNSSTIDAYDTGSAPGGSSKLCLSCHDGTMAIDTVGVLNGATEVTIPMNGLGTNSTMPVGAGKDTGFTRNLGTDLSNDHPISFTYNDAVATRDGELRKPSDVSSIVGMRTSRNYGGERPTLPLEAPPGTAPATDRQNGQMQCTTCHDPHLRDLNEGSNKSAKFLRLNRFQTTNQPSGTGFTPADDIICLACHDKAGVSWANSAHANKNVANYAYSDTAATQRDFPSGTEVWQVSCLNCHDTHTAKGARRLLRQGVENNATTTTQIAALEQTCYQCHGKNPIVSKSNGTVYPPKIEIDFTSTRHMPITSDDQNKTSPNESHNIGGTFNEGTVGVVDALNTALDCKSGASGFGKCGKDFLESTTQLATRHVECTDCHNPHRVVKFQDFRGLSSALGDLTKTPDGSTHPHDDSSGSTQKHTNIASGALRGSWGVEPNYDQTQKTDATFGTYVAGYAFASNPASFTVKRGDPGTSATANVSDTYVTREYQICLKCHSNYAYGSTPPTPGVSGGTTPSTANSVTKYSNQAMEFQAPSGHEGPATNACINKGWEAGAKATALTGNFNFNACNHRSWHPVMKPTGRTLTTRGSISTTNNPWRKPWANDVGGNTMYCSDCHGSNTTSASSVVPDDGVNTAKAWGPHGSKNDFVLKGAWTDAKGNTANLLCFKCHDSTAYSGTNTSSTRNTGFYDGGNTNRGNLHRYHANKLGELRCTWCHVAVPHGWKNKAFLVNLNDLGPEVGKTAGTVAPAGYYTNGPYYYKAALRVTTFAKSGAWSRDNCGGGQTDSNATSYMKNTMCNSPP